MGLISEAQREEIVLHIDILSDAIEAQTFANLLLSFDGLYRSINEILDPGSELEIDFLRSESGSVRAVIRSVRKDTKALFKSPFALIVFPILINVLSNWLSSDQIQIVVDDNHYIVRHGSERIVLPKATREVIGKVQQDSEVRRSAKKFFAVSEGDPNIAAVDFRSPARPMEPVVPIPRNKFGLIQGLPEVLPIDLPRRREVHHYRQMVVVVVAVLERSARRWQFIWSGQKISADILDDEFFNKMAQHEYEFGQGDLLNVDLLIEQELNEFVGAYENKKFHVLEVHSHKPGPKQAALRLN